MREYKVWLDITMSGEICVKAESEEEAKAIAYGKAGEYGARELMRHDFINVERTVVDAAPVDE